MNNIPCHSVVAAGAVVTKGFKDDSVVIGGVPAKVIRKRGVRNA